EEITIVVQVNGKVRDRLVVPADADEETIKARALESPSVKKFLNGGQPKQVHYVKGRLINFVV
ncbi:MAG: hypothetical protein NZ532_04360, partial [Thermoflexales bacterium]|nr:hypothetical protein [Thermoflexales bacterium]